jgi:hypothetical protein
MSLPGRLLYQLWHRPIGAARNSLRHGGPWVARETERQRRAMEAAAPALPRLDFAPVTPSCGTLHLLTGARFWWQTAYCLHSFALAADRSVDVEIYDDGTLASAHRDRLLALGLPIRFHDYATLRERLERHLPVARFPTLHERWLNYPHLRKIIDVHLASTGWKLVLDSDLLFFRRPAFVLDWLAAPDRPLHAVDCVESYGYSRPLLASLLDAPLPALLNVGLCGLRSEEIDWERLEFWSSRVIAVEGTNYYLEQALVALLAAGRACAVAPAADYVTLPSPDEIRHPRAVMHHYVDTAKRGYFRHAWRRFPVSPPL